MGGSRGFWERGSVWGTNCLPAERGPGRASPAVRSLLVAPSSACTGVPSLASPAFCSCRRLPSAIRSWVCARISENCPFESLSARNPSSAPPSVPCQASRVHEGRVVFTAMSGKLFPPLSYLPRNSYSSFKAPPSSSSPCQGQVMLPSFLTLALWCTAHVSVSCRTDPRSPAPTVSAGPA